MNNWKFLHREVEDSIVRLKGLDMLADAEYCPRGALPIVMDDQEAVFRQIMERVKKVADIS